MKRKTQPTVVLTRPLRASELMAAARDWTPIEADFRAGIKSVRAIAREHGVSDTAVLKQAKKEGWTRDLAGQVRARAAEMVRTGLQRGLQRNAVSEHQVVDKEAKVLAGAEMEQRTRTSKAARIIDRLFDELEAIGESKVSIADAIRNACDAAVASTDSEDAAGAVKESYAMLRDVLNQLGNPAARADTVKRLVEAHAKLTDVERRILKMDESSSISEFERSLKAMLDG